MRVHGRLGFILAVTFAVSACGDRRDSEENGEEGGDEHPGTGGGSGVSETTDDSDTSEPGMVGSVFDTLAQWDADAAVAAGDACSAEMQEPEPFEVVLMLVVDVSGSMSQLAPGTNVSKWEATRAALSQVIQTLPGEAAMGVVYYPNMNPQPLPHYVPTDDPRECVDTDLLVPPAVMDDVQKARLVASLDNVVVSGGTPTYTAYSVGLKALEDAALPGNKYVLLMTDGEPTYGVGCLGDGTARSSNIKPEFITDTVAAIETARGLMPPTGTFVIGSPGSERLWSKLDARPWLSQAASKGGTAPLGCQDSGPMFCHFDLTDQNTDFATGLNQALAQILGQVVACEFLPPVPKGNAKLDLDYVDVKMVAGDRTEYMVPRTTESACAAGSHGWYLNDDQSRLLLCPRTCASMHEDARAGINVYYGCTREIT